MKSIETSKEETRADKYLKILEILSKIPEDRLERLVSFLSKLDFDEDTLTGEPRAAFSSKGGFVIMLPVF